MLDTSDDVAYLAFLAGPSPPKNEYRQAISTNSIVPEYVKLWIGPLTRK